MKFAYKFQNLLGTIYRKGNLVFTSDGNSIISPVGNKLTIYDMKNNKARTLSLESRFNYTAIDLSPNGCLMVAINERGQAEMISMISHTVIHTYKFKGPVYCIRFSPDGRYFAAAQGNIVFVFNTPGEITGEYNRFVLKRHYFASNDDIVWIDWSSDSKILAVGSKDNTVKINAIDWLTNFRPYILGGHTDSIVGCFFELNSFDLNTVSRNGQLFLWDCSQSSDQLLPRDKLDDETDEPKQKKKRDQSESDDDLDDIDTSKTYEKTQSELNERFDRLDVSNEADGIEDRDDQGKKMTGPKSHPFYYKRLARHYLMNELLKVDKNVSLTAVSYHKKTKILVTAFSCGTFYLHELPDVSLIHSLSISELSIQTVTFNGAGDWIALGVPGLGQLLVWEWQSEQYVMKQQGHSSEMTCIAYSPDGQYIVTGGTDAKVKLWNVNSGFCFVTFDEHQSGVTAVEFSHNKKFFASASLDGTVRAYDITRYRNFRTFTSPRPVQFSSIAIDYSDEFICAGGQDIFEIFLWSMKLGRLLEILSGHEGPVISLAFPAIPTSTTLVSGSWDKTIKIWNCLEQSSDHETIDILSDVTVVAFNPNGEDVAVAAINGNIQIFNIRDVRQVATIEGRNDLGSGVSEVDIITAKKNLEAKCFTTMVYSADGICLLAGGRSKNVCIYNVKEGILLKKFEISQNHSFDGLDDYINRRNMSEFGNMALVEERSSLEGGNVAIQLPGVQKGDLASRNFKPEVRVQCVRFSPTAQSWAAATTEGLLIFSLDRGMVFDPFNLSLEVTPKVARKCLQNEEYSLALIMALKINEPILVQEIMEKIPYSEIELVTSSLPNEYAERLLQIIAKHIGSSSHVEFYLRWSCCLLQIHGPKENLFPHHALLALEQNLNKKYDMLSKICDFNKYTIKLLIEMGNRKKTEDLSGSGQQVDTDLESDDELLLLKPIRAESDEDVYMSDDADLSSGSK